MSNDDDRSELALALYDLRKAAELNQVTVAEETGISQARLSRIEQGQSVPTEDDTWKLLVAYDASLVQRDWVLGLTRDAQAGVRDTRLVVQRGNTLAMQQRWRRIESQTQLVREFHPGLVLGGLQTAAYSSLVLEEPIDSPAVADRQARRERMLTEDQPRFELLQTEGALRYRVGSAQVMTEQLAAIDQASRRPNVEFGLIPWRRAVNVTPVCGFTLYDDAAVVIGLEVAAARLTKADDVAEFTKLFDRLRSAAVWGEEARSELARIAAENVT